MKVDEDLKPCARVVVLQLPVVWCEGIKVDMSRYCEVLLSLLVERTGHVWQFRFNVGPRLALSWPYVAPSCRQILPNYVKTPSTCHFFRSGAPPERQNHVKRVVF